MSQPSEALADLTLRTFSDRLASGEPVPGGGSAAAVAASLAASLVAMVARLSIGRPKYEPFRPTLERGLEVGERARIRFLELAQDDATSYAAYSAALKLPRDGAEQAEARAAAIRAAARGAAEVPMAVVRECHALIHEAEAMAGRSNLNAASDLDVAGLLARAAARAAGANVLVNVPSMGDEPAGGAMTAELQGHLRDIESTVARVTEQVGRSELRDPEPA